MAYTNLELCPSYFTQGQKDRMLQTLLNAPLLQRFRHADVSNGDLVINQPTNWPLPNFPPSGNAIIRNGNLIIGPNGSLVVSSGHIILDQGKQVIIEPKGKLKISNATFTANCSTWGGIVVKGAANQPQSTSTHGYLKMNQGASIQNANTGALSVNGGIIECDGGQFRNNYTGANIGNYSQKHTITKFVNTKFVTDQCDRFTSGFGFTPRSHLNLNYVQGNPYINIIGCKFLNSLPVNPTWFGVWSVFSDVEVLANTTDPANPILSTFEDLPAGIYQYYSSKTGLRVKKSTFTDCGIGIYAFNTRKLDVTSNTFNLGGLPPSALYTTQFGTWFEGRIPTINFANTAGESNVFQRTEGNYQSVVGSLASNLGNFTHFFKNNQYFRLHIGNLANNFNGDDQSGLVYLCNYNEAPQRYDFSLPAGATIRELQGQTQGTAGIAGAGNVFSYSNPDGNFSDFENAGPGNIDYFHSPDAGHAPLDFFGIFPFFVQTFACDQNREPDNEGELAQIKTEYFADRATLMSLSTQTNDSVSSRQIVQLRANMDQLCGQVLQYETEHDNRADTLLRWMSLYNRPEAELHIALYHFADRAYEKADSVLALIPSKFVDTPDSLISDLADCRYIFNLLAGLGTDTLSEATKVQLRVFANRPYANSTQLAKGLLMTQGEWFRENYQLPEDIIPRYDEVPKPLENKANNYLFPNPAHTALYARVEAASGVLYAYNAQGQLIRQVLVPAGSTTAEISVADWPIGLYHIRFQPHEGAGFVEKVVIQR
jgi:hypothetical protein